MSAFIVTSFVALQLGTLTVKLSSFTESVIYITFLHIIQYEIMNVKKNYQKNLKKFCFFRFADL